MAHFMFRWRLKDAAIKGLVAKPQDRTGPARQMIESFGGRMERYYFMFGEFDGFAICDMADSRTAVALAMASRATGNFENFEMVPLFTPQEAEHMMRRAQIADAAYLPPGGYVP